MRKKESFLNTKTNKRKFDAFNVFSNIFFIGLLALFIVSMSKCISDMINSSTPSDFVMPLIMRIGAIILTILPNVIARIFKLNMPKIVLGLYYLFLFLSVFLGTFVGLYSKTTLYNRFVHTCGGIIMGVLAMFFVRPICKDRQTRLHPMLVFLLVFTFSMCFGACWEMWEFGWDAVLDMNMQGYANLFGRQALLDTMLDICCNCVGALIISTICAVCSYKYNNFVEYFKITKRKQNNNTEIEEIEE